MMWKTAVTCRYICIYGRLFSEKERVSIKNDIESEHLTLQSVSQQKRNTKAVRKRKDKPNHVIENVVMKNDKKIIIFFKKN